MVNKYTNETRRERVKSTESGKIDRFQLKSNSKRERVKKKYAFKHKECVYIKMRMGYRKIEEEGKKL